jgi:tRNA-dihydrouridine synthase
MAIKVCNKHFHEQTEKDIYIARPSIFGNPWSHMDSSYPDAKKTETRKEAIDNYLQYFLQQYKNNVEFQEIVDHLTELHKQGQDINLVCWCAPHECHGDIIKKFIEYKVTKGK